ncbi:MAG: NAD(P)-binding protein [Burkholderiales bacterium]|nr:NAD(P)-binding protein [Burkholderiales bacterium]
MGRIETDYLIIGSGAAGLAFADTLLAESDAHITIVDRHGKPGGHWNDAYPFVALHQPSAFYGVNSMALGAGRKDTAGVNRGLYELASGPEISGYFDRVMKQRLLPSGRVDYRPMCDWQGDGRFVSILSGAVTEVTVRRKVVDAAYLSPRVPATHTPRFAASADAWLLPPGALPQLWHAPAGRDRPRHFAIIGGGKTAMDAAIWLLDSGVPPESISWVVPRDSWLLNRLQTQPGDEFFEHSIGGQADQMEACAKAGSVDDLYDRLEACGTLLRIDPSRRPTMFHLATISVGELEALRRIRHVIRKGHVRAIDADGLELEHGREALPPGTLCIDCTASAVEQRPIQQVFQGDRIVLQLVRLPLPTFSAALIARVEAAYGDDATKNRLCGPVPFPWRTEDYPRSLLANMANQYQWSQDKALRGWIRDSRLDGFGKLIASVDPQDAARQAILARFRTHAAGAMANLPRLLAG